MIFVLKTNKQAVKANLQRSVQDQVSFSAAEKQAVNNIGQKLASLNSEQVGKWFKSVSGQVNVPTPQTKGSPDLIELAVKSFPEQIRALSGRKK